MEKESKICNVCKFLSSVMLERSEASKGSFVPQDDKE